MALNWTNKRYNWKSGQLNQLIENDKQKLEIMNKKLAELQKEININVAKGMK